MADSNPQELSQGAQDASGVPEGMVGMMGVHPGAGMDLQSQQVTELQLQQMQMAAAAAAAAAAAGGGVDLPSSPKRKKSDTLDRGDTTKKREKNRVAAAASRARKKEYVQNLEKAIHVLTTEKLELQVKVATLTNQLWEQSIKIDELEKQIAELKALKAGGKPPSADDAAPQPYPPEDGSGAPQPDAGMPSWIAQLLADAFSAAEDTAETLLLRSALGVLLRDLARRSADSRALVASATLPAVLQLLRSPTEQAPTEARLHDMVALTMRILAEEAGNEEMDDISRHLTIDVLREAWDNPRGSEGRLLPSVLDLVAIPASCKDLQPHATAHLEHVEQLVQKLLGVVIERNAQKHLSDFLARVTSALGRPNKKTSRPPSPTTAAAPSPATAQTKKRRASRKRDRDDPEVDALQEARLRELLEKQRREFEELDAFEVEGLSSAASKKKQPPSPRVLAPPSPSPSPSPSPAPAPITQTTLIPESQTSIVPDSQHSSKRVRFSDDGGFGEPPPPSPPPTAPAKNRAQQPRGAEWLKKQMDSLYSPAARRTPQKPAATAVSTPSASKPSASAATGKTPGLKVVFGASRQQAASQTPAQHHPTAVVVAFTGFSNNEQLEKDLVGKAKALGAAVLARGVADSTLTHVVSFQGRRTTITLVGAVCGLWVVSQDWLDESHAAGRFVDESPFGQRFPKSPFEGKAFCLSQDFVADTKPAIVEHCKTLISLGKGVLLEDGERHPADFTLVSSDHGGDGAGRGSSGITFTLRMFFDLIQPQL